MFTQFDVEMHFDGRLAIVYLNNPATLNALNRPTLSELRRFFESASADDNVRAVAISGRGRAFCSGQDLAATFADEDEKNDITIVKKLVTDFYNPVVLELTRCKKPVVALVNGPAVGAGAMLALICDFVLASEKAYFSQAFSGIGLIPDTGGTYFLPRLLGRQMANYLAFTGKKLYAEEAKTLGLVAEVFNEDEFNAKSMEILEKMCNMPTAAIKFTKKAFADSYDSTLKQQLRMEAELQQRAANTEDFAEGIAAFNEKRKPVYKGK